MKFVQQKTAENKLNVGVEAHMVDHIEKYIQLFAAFLAGVVAGLYYAIWRIDVYKLKDGSHGR